MTLYRKLILTRVEGAISTAKAIFGVNQSGLKGLLREIAILDLMRPLLPFDVRLGTGVIFTADNRQSNEQGIVSFDRRILAPIILE